jgi:hypothetical protein
MLADRLTNSLNDPLSGMVTFATTTPSRRLGRAPPCLAHARFRSFQPDNETSA